jgi:hypothetical protein
MTSDPKIPSAFISYSWSSEEHESKVLKLAEELTSDGVKVVIDKWDLKEGHDIHAFMERMIADASIDRVLVICDKDYKEKADGRRGGVGTETQIISPDVYAKGSQEKFLPIIFERDPESGEPYVPIYMKGRYYIDLSNEENYAEGYQQLVRNLYGKPVSKRPALGKPPAFLLESVSPSLITTSKLNQFREAVKKERANAAGYLADYFDSLDEAFRAERILEIKMEVGYDDKIVESIERFLPYRDEFLSLLLFLSRYAHTGEYIEELARGFERLLQSKFNTKHTGYDVTRDNLSFILWEMFLYTIATFMHAERFGAADLPLQRRYFIQSEEYSSRGALRSYPVLEPPIASLDQHRNARSDPRWLSMSSHILQSRVPAGPITFSMIVEADFILWLRSVLQNLEESWWPKTLVYAENTQTFPQFLRAASKSYFDKLKLVLGVTSVDDLRARLPKEESRYPQSDGFWGGSTRYHKLINLDQLAKL